MYTDGPALLQPAAATPRVDPSYDDVSGSHYSAMMDGDTTATPISIRAAHACSARAMIALAVTACLVIGVVVGIKYGGSGGSSTGPSPSPPHTARRHSTLPAPPAELPPDLIVAGLDSAWARLRQNQAGLNWIELG